MKATTELAFETLIGQHLLKHGGYVSRDPADFDKDLALLPDDLLGYLQDTQPEAWQKLEAIHKDQLGPTLLAALDKAARQQGILHLLRHGFDFYGKKLRLATFRPAHGKNPQVEEDYAANRLAVARQVHFDPKQTGLSLDLVLFLNGIPVVTAELKNALTDQTAVHARSQYRDDRDPQAPIFRFKQRALVHFAVGSDEAWMATRLAGKKTFFLPFNRGHGTAGGNPPVSGKHRTCYLWEEIWQRDSLLDILRRFMFVEVAETTRPDGSKSTQETMIFPRYHQLDCVRTIEKAARDNGAGHNYLVQHSAGSGKSLSIAWLAYRLQSLHDGEDQPVYDGVFVVTDRRVLDRQLQDTIYQLDHQQGVVRRIEEGQSKSGQLAEALAEKAPIVICTLGSFGYVADKLEAMPEGRYAIIVDEAHSSQSGDMAKTMKEILGASSIAEKFEEEADDVEAPDQAALRAALARGPQQNLSYFAFTATPKFKTLELFGHQGADGKPAPFHLYAMRQAIEEGFILDVLRGYTTYKRYFSLVKAIEDDPQFDKKKASRALARFVSLHPANIAQKAEVIIEHFRACVRHKLDGQAKAMVVTGSRLHAVKYKLAFDEYLEEKGYVGEVSALVAFSGEVVDPDDSATTDKPYREPEMNTHPVTKKPVKESEVPEVFDSPHFNVLIVANKYQTGFDQKKLCAMYVDKRLAGVQAVQTLSRLNRTMPGKKETFVLDFVNDRDDILASFQPYHEQTGIDESVDPQRLYELKNELDAAQVYYQPEVDQFARVFFKRAAEVSAQDNGRLNAALDPATDRFKALDDELRDGFRDRLQAYCNLYGFLSQVVPFSDVSLEKLYAFGKMLLKKIGRGGGNGPLQLDDDVALHYYRLEKIAEGDLVLEPDQTGKVIGPTDTGTGKPDDTPETLSSLIQRINDRFGTAFDAQDLIDGVTDQLVADEGLQKAADANDKENFRYALDPALDEALINRHANHGEFIDKMFSDEALLAFFRRQMLNEVYGRLGKS